MKRDEILARVVPQFFPKHWLENPGIVFTDFPSRIRIGYVLRGDASYSYLCGDELLGLGVAIDELHSAAIINLANLPSANIHTARVAGGAEGWIIARDDNFAAARILLPTAQACFAAELDQPFLVALSHRDDCFCWSANQDRARQEQHTREAKERFLECDYNLTPDILRFDRGEFELHHEATIS